MNAEKFFFFLGGGSGGSPHNTGATLFEVSLGRAVIGFPGAIINLRPLAHTHSHTRPVFPGTWLPTPLHLVTIKQKHKPVYFIQEMW